MAPPGWLERLPREAAMLACLGLSLFLLVTLISFDPNDPGWSSSGTGEPVRNLAGAVGAWIADVLLSLCGYVAFLLPCAALASLTREMAAQEVALELKNAESSGLLHEAGDASSKYVIMPMRI